MENTSSNWAYPQKVPYRDVLNRTSKEVTIDYGKCPYCKAEHILVEDAHEVMSCLECLRLDNYLIKE